MDFINEKILALSWKQPYASLMLHGKIETRVWPTHYRGLVLICASLKEYSDQEFDGVSGEKQKVRAMNILREEFGGKNKTVESTLGMTIAIGKLVGSRLMTKDDEDKCFVRYREPWYENVKPKPGQLIIPPPKLKKLWCHIYEDVRPIVPFAWKGTQGWKEVTDEQKKQIILL